MENVNENCGTHLVHARIEHGLKNAAAKLKNDAMISLHETKRIKNIIEKPWNNIMEVTCKKNRCKTKNRLLLEAFMDKTMIVFKTC